MIYVHGNNDVFDTHTHAQCTHKERKKRVCRIRRAIVRSAYAHNSSNKHIVVGVVAVVFVVVIVANCKFAFLFASECV